MCIGEGKFFSEGFQLCFVLYMGHDMPQLMIIVVDKYFWITAATPSILASVGVVPVWNSCGRFIKV